MRVSAVEGGSQSASFQTPMQTGQQELKKASLLQKGFVEPLELLLKDKFPIYTSVNKSRIHHSQPYYFP